MKLKVLMVIAVLFLIGCGSNEAEQKYQGVSEKVDYVTLGMKYLSKGDISKAISNFDNAIKQDPQNSDNYVTLGQVYLRLKNYPRADAALLPKEKEWVSVCLEKSEKTILEKFFFFSKPFLQGRLSAVFLFFRSTHWHRPPE